MVSSTWVETGDIRLFVVEPTMVADDIQLDDRKSP